MNKIIEIIEFGFPKSLIQRKNEPISELIDTELLRLEINSIIEEPHQDESMAEFRKRRSVWDDTFNWISR